MFLRKTISAYVATAAIAIVMACSMSVGLSAYSLLALIGMIALVASPVVFLYGTFVSIVLELITKQIPKRTVGIFLSGAGHAGFGALFTLKSEPSLFFYVAFAATAFVYFLIDMLQQLTEQGAYRQKVRAVLLAVPVVAAAVATNVAFFREGISLGVFIG